MKNVMILFGMVKSAFVGLEKFGKIMVVALCILAVVNGFAFAYDLGFVPGVIYVVVVFASIVVELLFPKEKNVSRAFLVLNIIVSFWGLGTIFHPVVSAFFCFALIVCVIFWAADQDIKRLAGEKSDN